MIKVLCCRFQEFWALVNMFTVKRVFRNKPSYAFTEARLSESITSEILDPSDLFLSEHRKFNVDSNNVQKKQRKRFIVF